MLLNERDCFSSNESAVQGSQGLLAATESERKMTELVNETALLGLVLFYTAVASPSGPAAQQSKLRQASSVSSNRGEPGCVV